MTMKGEITKFAFHPMVDLVPSVLYFWVYVPELGHEVMFQEEGSIPYLSAKFQFEIVNESDWDFTGFEGRKCRSG